MNTQQFNNGLQQTPVAAQQFVPTTPPQQQQYAPQVAQAAPVVVQPAPAQLPTQQQPVQLTAPTVPCVQAGNYDFVVSKVSLFKDVPDKFNEGRTKDELRLEVLLLGTQDPANQNQPVKAYISNINAKVRSLVVDIPNKGRVETGLSKVFTAFGLSLPPDTNPDNLNFNGLEGMYGHGKVEIGEKKGTPYIRRTNMFPSQNMEYIAQNQSLAGQLFIS